MLEREALNTSEASKAAEHALQIAPGDPRALYLRALAAFDAGKPSAALFEEARRADPSNSAILLKQAAALLAEEDAQGAENLLLSALRSAPGWVEAHRTLAQIRWEGGLAGRPTASLEDAVQREPDNAALWLEYTRLADRFGGEGEALAALEQAERALGSHQDLDFIRAQVLTESSRFAEIGDLVARLAKRPDPAAQLLACRWYGRMHDFKPLALRAKSLVDQGFGGDAWPYLAMAWRGLEDSRWDWLERGGDLVRTFDLADNGIDIGRTAEVLRELHKTRRPPLEQSLRGGTQTDGMLFANTAPEIMQLRDAITTAVEDYVANLPEPDPRHPLLGRPRAQFRFTGAWSVRLTGGGFHVSHIHNEGDISSACYIVMPELDDEAEPDAGCLVVGEPPREFGLDWAPLKTVRPVPGRLALFPSWAWHGTRSFSEGERMTVAFDVKLDG
jgi:tetratricopeptide (TPR) repeat protein